MEDKETCVFLKILVSQTEVSKDYEDEICLTCMDIPDNFDPPYTGL